MTSINTPSIKSIMNESVKKHNTKGCLDLFIKDTEELIELFSSTTGVKFEVETNEHGHSSFSYDTIFCTLLGSTAAFGKTINIPVNLPMYNLQLVSEDEYINSVRLEMLSLISDAIYGTLDKDQQQKVQQAIQDPQVNQNGRALTS